MSQKLFFVGIICSRNAYQRWAGYLFNQPVAWNDIGLRTVFKWIRLKNGYPKIPNPMCLLVMFPMLQKIFGITCFWKTQMSMFFWVEGYHRMAMADHPWGKIWWATMNEWMWLAAIVSYLTWCLGGTLILISTHFNVLRRKRDGHQ